jgi:hypothetical protein
MLHNPKRIEIACYMENLTSIKFTSLVNLQYAALRPPARPKTIAPVSSVPRTNLIWSLTQPVQTNRNIELGGGDEHNREGRSANLDADGGM